MRDRSTWTSHADLPACWVLLRDAHWAGPPCIIEEISAKGFTACPRGLLCQVATFAQTPSQPAQMDKPCQPSQEPVVLPVLPARGSLKKNGRNASVVFPVPFSTENSVREEVLEPELSLKRPAGTTAGDHVRAWALQSLLEMYNFIPSTRSLATVKHKAAKDPAIFLAPVEPSAIRLPAFGDSTEIRSALAARLYELCSSRMTQEHRDAARKHGCSGISMLACHRMHNEGYVNRRPNIARQCQHCREVVAHAVGVLVMVVECHGSRALSEAPRPYTTGMFADRVAREITRVRFSHPMPAKAWASHVGTTVLRHLVDGLSPTCELLTRAQRALDATLSTKLSEGSQVDASMRVPIPPVQHLTSPFISELSTLDDFPYEYYRVPTPPPQYESCGIPPPKYEFPSMPAPSLKLECSRMPTPPPHLERTDASEEKAPKKPRKDTWVRF